MRRAIGLLLALLSTTALLACDGGEPAAGVPAATVTASASPVTAEPGAASGAAAPDDSPTSTDVLTVRSLDAVVDGDLLHVTLEVGAWPKVAEDGGVFYLADVFPEGYNAAPAQLQGGPHRDPDVPEAMLNIFSTADGRVISIPGDFSRRGDRPVVEMVVRLPEDWPPLIRIEAYVVQTDPQTRQSTVEGGRVSSMPVAGTVESDLPTTPSVVLVPAGGLPER